MLSERTLSKLRGMRQCSANGHKVKDLFQMVLNAPDLWEQAYGNIYANKGAMTPGVDGLTMDGYSHERAENLRELLRENRYVPTPGRREYVPKPNGKQRPLGMPTANDKQVQEVWRMVLEAIYEPVFQDSSHGFRPKKSCHTALKDIGYWTGTKWFIEFDIEGYFDNIDHKILMGLLEKKIDDTKFLNVIRKMAKAGYVEEWKYHHTYSGTPQGGIVTPPTKLQTFFFEVRIARVRIDSKDDIDLVLGYFDPLHEGPDEVPFVRPIRSLQAVVDVGRNVFQTANDPLQCCVHGRLSCQLLALLLQTGDTLAQAGQPGLKFGLVDEPLRVTVDEACDTLPQLADQRFDRRKRRAVCAGLRLQAAPIFLRKSFRVGQQRTDFLPDGEVEPIRPDLGILTDTLAAKAIRIRPQAAVIGVGAGLAFPGPRAEAFAIIGI